VRSERSLDYISKTVNIIFALLIMQVGFMRASSEPSLILQTKHGTVIMTELEFPMTKKLLRISRTDILPPLRNIMIAISKR